MSQILIAHGCPNMQHTINALMEVKAFSTTLCDNNDAVLAKLEINRFDLLILSLSTPGLDSLELCQAIRTIQEYDDLAIIILLDSPHPVYPEKLLTAEADAYLLASLVPTKLTGVVQNVLVQKQWHRLLITS